MCTTYILQGGTRDSALWLITAQTVTSSPGTTAIFCHHVFTTFQSLSRPSLLWVKGGLADWSFSIGRDRREGALCWEGPVGSCSLWFPSADALPYHPSQWEIWPTGYVWPGLYLSFLLWCHVLIHFRMVYRARHPGWRGCELCTQ